MSFLLVENVEHEGSALNKLRAALDCWRRDHDHDPARVYVSGPFHIIWDPVGRTEDEPGGWWLESLENDRTVIDIFPTLREAKAAAASFRWGKQRLNLAVETEDGGDQ